MKTDTTIRVPENIELNDWNKVVMHPLQTWEWGEFRQKNGTKINRLAVYQDNQIKEAWQITFHPIPYTKFNIGYFPKGPLPNLDMINAIKKVGKENSAIFIQFEPNIVKNSQAQLPINLIPSHHPLFSKYSFVLDISKSEAELLSQMHPKTRYNIRVATKHNVQVKEDNSPEAFQKFLSLTEETAARQKFYTHPSKYYSTLWNILHPKGMANLWTATYQDKIIVAWIIFIWKDTVYYPYGASVRDNREVMAPNLILWEIARWAKKSGFKKFDLWGSMGPNPDPNHPWYGFHRFKEGYRPELVEYIGSYDLIINPLLYQTYRITDKIRWTVLKGIKR
jgi:lipid II:glycine glycyltransferase (peptidoglycan interpeptide bridge formation enzyme)